MAKIIRDYWAIGPAITWYENDNTEQTQGTSNTLSSDEDLVFTGETLISASSNNRDVTFSAPNINFESVITLRNEEKNSITFENSNVNFDKATWNDDPTSQGKIIFSGESKLNLTSKSNKLLIICNDISGTITLDLENSFAYGSTFSIQANSANNLIINNTDEYEVVPTTDGSTTTYTVNRVSKGKEIKKITLGEETYFLKDETAREDLSKLSKVAKTGSYDDLSDKPTVATKTSELINDSDFVNKETLSEYEKKVSIEINTSDIIWLEVDIYDNRTIVRDEVSTFYVIYPSTIDSAYLCEVDFTSGSTPTTMIYVKRDIPLLYLGDDITDGVFVPVANKRYTIIVYCDGVNYRAIVKGVPYVS